MFLDHRSSNWVQNKWSYDLWRKSSCINSLAAQCVPRMMACFHCRQFGSSVWASRTTNRFPYSGLLDQACHQVPAWSPCAWLLHPWMDGFQFFLGPDPPFSLVAVGWFVLICLLDVLFAREHLLASTSCSIPPAFNSEFFLCLLLTTILFCQLRNSMSIWP